MYDRAMKNLNAFCQKNGEEISEDFSNPFPALFCEGMTDNNKIVQAIANKFLILYILLVKKSSSSDCSKSLSGSTK